MLKSPTIAATGLSTSAGTAGGLAGALFPLSFRAERGTFEDPLTDVVLILLLLCAIRIWLIALLTYPLSSYISGARVTVFRCGRLF